MKELQGRNITIYNYGLMDFKGLQTETPSWTHHPKFLIPIFKDNEILTKFFSQTLIRNINSVYKRYLINKNLQIKESTKEEKGFHFFQDIINKDRPLDKNSFIYVHLMMPHYPFTFEDEFLEKENNLDNYIKYWNFVNNKLLEVLKDSDLTDYKIVITGDHGYRKYPDIIDPYQTFGAFYGFDKENLKKIENVQDIGFLILNNFK